MPSRALAASLLALARLASLASPPHIVIILADDLGYADLSLSPHHQPEVATPHIDALAADGGVTFARAYATASICAPSRAGLLAFYPAIPPNVAAERHSARRSTRSRKGPPLSRGGPLEGG